jgi:hypothetical protein
VLQVRKLAIREIDVRAGSDYGNDAMTAMTLELDSQFGERRRATAGAVEKLMAEDTGYSARDQLGVGRSRVVAHDVPTQLDESLT